MTATMIGTGESEEPAALAPAPETRRSTTGVAVALAWREGRLLLRHPAFVAGIVLTLLLFRLTGGEAREWRAFSSSIALVLVPLAWLTLIAANLGALRARRHGTAELFDSLPADPASRTAAHCVSTVATASVTVALLAAGAAVTAASSDARGGVLLGEMAVAVPIVVGGGVVGVAVARWLPRAWVTVLAIFVTVQIEVWFADSVSSRWRWLSFWVDPTHSGLDALDVRPSGWHLVWLAAWVLTMAVVAVARHGIRRPVLLVLAGALVVASLAGWAQTRPLADERAEQMASLLEEPAAHQVCERHGSVTYCAYEQYADVIGDWRATVAAVLQHAPVDGRELRVTQRAPTILGSPDCSPMDYLDSVPPEVRARVDPAAVWRADGQVHPSLVLRERAPCGGGELAWVYTAVQTGAWAVGLPPTPAAGDHRCAADGQARAAVALWLGAQASPAARAALERVVAETPRDRHDRLDFAGADTAFPDAWDTPPQWGVRWHVADAHAAQRLLRVHPGDVVAVLAAHWDLVTDLSTPTSELLDLVGLPHGAVVEPSGDCPDTRTV